MELNLPQDAVRQNLAKMLAANGGRLPVMPDGPRLEHFEPRALSDAIYGELQRGLTAGFSKITLTMDPQQAAELAGFLRNATMVKR